MGAPGYRIAPAAAAAESASTRELEFDAADLTDGTWTLLDPDSLVDTIAHSAGYNVLTWAELAAGSADMVPINSGNFRGPRWYKLLQLDSVQIVSDDLVMLQTRLENDESVDDISQAIVVGACIDPTSTVLTTIQGAGGVYNANTSSNPAYGVWTVNAQTGTPSVSLTHGITANLYGALNVCGGAYVSLDASGDRVKSGCRSGTGVITTGQSVYLMVGFGTRGNSNTITAGDQSSIQVGFRVTTVVNT